MKCTEINTEIDKGKCATGTKQYEVWMNSRIKTENNTFFI